MNNPVDRLIKFRKEFLENSIPKVLNEEDIIFFDARGLPLFSINQISSRCEINRNKIAYTIASLGIDAVNQHYNAWLYHVDDVREVIGYLILEYELKYLKSRKK